MTVMWTMWSLWYAGMWETGVICYGHTDGLFTLRKHTSTAKEYGISISSWLTPPPTSTLLFFATR